MFFNLPSACRNWHRYCTCAIISPLLPGSELRAADPQQQAMLHTYLTDTHIPQGARILEVGCGTGAVTRVLAAWPGVVEAVGVDPSPVFVAKARELGAGLTTLTFEEADTRWGLSESRLRLCFTLVHGENGLANQRCFGLRAPCVDAGPRGLDRPVLRRGGASKFGEVGRQPGPTALCQQCGAAGQLVGPAREGS